MATEPCPCPKCGAYQLVYGGTLVWRRGERRPSRKTASKRGKSPSAWDRKQARASTRLRADYTRHSLYHCANCRAEFYYDTGQSDIHLYEEGVAGKYVYDKAAQSWQFRSFAQALQAVRKLSPADHGHKPQVRPPETGTKRKRGPWSRKSSRYERGLGKRLELVLFVGGFVVVVVGLTALVLALLSHEGLKRGAMLGAGIGLLQAILNGPRPKSKRENPSGGAIFGRVLLWALGAVPAGAGLGALVGGIHGAFVSAPLVARVIGHGVSGAVLGGLAALLLLEVVFAMAAAIGTSLGHRKRNIFVEMADAVVGGIRWEGGFFVAFPGLFIGAITGIILALACAGGT